MIFQNRPLMKTRYALILALLALAATPLAAEWISLFNGKDLGGWQRLNGEAEYRVENGAIVGKSRLNTPNTFLATEKAYGDFILEFEFRVDHGLNSGVQFRSLSKPSYRNGRVHGYQFEIDTSDRAWSAGIYDEARRGWLYTGDYNPPSRTAFKAGQWNRGRIECIGAEIRTFLNGQPISHLIDDETSEGFIALQVHSIRNAEQVGTEVRWRNLRINTNPSEVTSDPPIYIRNLLQNQLSRSQAKLGWKRLFNGESATGFVGIDSDSFPQEGWKTKDGILTIAATPKGMPKKGGDIVTKAEFSAFDFECMFRLTEGANSGIKYFVSEYKHRESGKPAMLGLEYQLLDDERHPDAKKGAAGNRTCASLYDLIPAYDRVHGRSVGAKPNAWNHARIVAYPDGKVRHWLNGFIVLEYQRGDNIYAALVARSKYHERENFGLAQSGKILLQDHNDEVSFPSIRVRPLD